MELERNLYPYFMRIYIPTGVMVGTSWISFLVTKHFNELNRTTVKQSYIDRPSHRAWPHDFVGHPPARADQHPAWAA